MINTFKENDNNNILQNKDDYKLLSKVAYKKHQNNIENAIQHTNYKYDPESIYHHKLKRFFIIQILEKLLYHMLVLILDLKNGIMI